MTLPFSSSRYSLLLAGLAVAAFAGPASPALADPLNPLDFPSLGNVTLASGTYTIDTTGKVPKLTGPGTNLSGVVSTTGVAVFRFDDLTVTAAAVLTAAGDPGQAGRPVALLTSGNLTFAGKFNANGANGGDGARSTGGVGGAGRFGGARGSDARALKPGGVAGLATAGAVLGRLCPDYYRAILRSRPGADVDMAQAGAGFGLNAGLFTGVVVGVLAIAIVTYFELRLSLARIAAGLDEGKLS
jgi:hypothetical protein